MPSSPAALRRRSPRLQPSAPCVDWLEELWRWGAAPARLVLGCAAAEDVLAAALAAGVVAAAPAQRAPHHR